MPILDRAEGIPFIMAKLDMAKMAFFHDFWIPYCNPSAKDSESIKPLSAFHSGLKREW